MGNDCKVVSEDIDGWEGVRLSRGISSMVESVFTVGTGVACVVGKILCFWVGASSCVFYKQEVILFGDGSGASA